MGRLEEGQNRTLADVDRADREALEETKRAILRVYNETQPSSLPALMQALDASDIDALGDRSLLRLALLSLLNTRRLSFSDERPIAAAG
jgi:hypothetical protein